MELLGPSHEHEKAMELMSACQPHVEIRARPGYALANPHGHLLRSRTRVVQASGQPEVPSIGGRFHGLLQMVQRAKVQCRRTLRLPCGARKSSMSYLANRSRPFVCGGNRSGVNSRDTIVRGSPLGERASVLGCETGHRLASFGPEDEVPMAALRLNFWRSAKPMEPSS